jgi:hypothetical protein
MGQGSPTGRVEISLLTIKQGCTTEMTWMLCVLSVGFAQIRSDVLPRVILPVLLSNVLRPLVVFGGKIQGNDNLFRTLNSYEGLSRYSVKLLIILPIGLQSREPCRTRTYCRIWGKVSELRRLIKSVTEDGPRQVRDIFEINSLDLLLVFFMIEYSQNKKYTDF